MVLTAEEKAYIIARQVGDNPASGLSSEHYKKLVGVANWDQLMRGSGGSNLSNPGLKKRTPKKQLKKHLKKLIGGLSEEESTQILSTMAYKQVAPEKMNPINNLVDFSETRRQLSVRAKKRMDEGIAGDDLLVYHDPRADDVLQILQEAEKPLKHAKTLGDYEDFSKSSKGLKPRAGSSKKSTKSNPWIEFYKKTSKWSCFKSIPNKDKMKCCSAMYRIANEYGVDKIKTIEKQAFTDYDDFRDYIQGNTSSPIWLKG